MWKEEGAWRQPSGGPRMPRNRGPTACRGFRIPCPLLDSWWPYAPDIGVSLLRTVLNPPFILPNFESEKMPALTRGRAGHDQGEERTLRSFWVRTFCFLAEDGSIADILLAAESKQACDQGSCQNTGDGPTPPSPGGSQPCHLHRQTCTPAGWDVL